MECIGHVKKGIGSRLRKLKNGVKVSDGKGLGGKGRLKGGKMCCRIITVWR